MKLIPLEDRVIILPEEAPRTSKGGVHLPDRVREREAPKRGQVLAVGPGRFNEIGFLIKSIGLVIHERVLNPEVRLPMDIKVGDVVVYGEYAGFDYQEGDRKLKIVRISEIQAKVEP